MNPPCVFWAIPDISPIHRTSASTMSVILHNANASPLPNNSAASVGTYYLFWAPLSRVERKARKSLIYVFFRTEFWHAGTGGEGSRALLLKPVNSREGGIGAHESVTYRGLLCQCYRSPPLAETVMQVVMRRRPNSTALRECGGCGMGETRAHTHTHTRMME